MTDARKTPPARPAQTERPLYIAVEGPIGAGKTTLVHRLAPRFGAQVVLEAFEDNPFLPLFYEDRARYAFQTQIFFLTSRFRQQEALVQPDLFRPSIIADYHLLKDRIFAELTLAGAEMSLYERVYRSLESQILPPDVVIYVHAPVEAMLERIARRGRAFEADFDPDYLRELARAYQRFFARYTGAPVLRLDNSDLDYASETDAAERVLDAIERDVRRLVGV